MTKAELHEQVLRLPDDQRIELLQELWDDVAPALDLEVTPELVTLLQARRAAAIANPGSGVPYPLAHARIRQSLRSA